MNEAAKVSRERLLKLLDITETFNKIACENSALQTECRLLLSQNATLKQKLNDIDDETNLANSI